MRDDRYKGTSLPRPMRKLCRMSEREVDRCQPERLKAQALTALVAEGGGVSAKFKERLISHDMTPTFFGIRELASSAQSGLEVQTVHNLQQGLGSRDALAAALSERGRNYAREQQCRLVADRESYATKAAQSVRDACQAAANEAAALILAGQRVPANTNRVQLGENLLGSAAFSGGIR